MLLTRSKKKPVITTGNKVVTITSIYENEGNIVFKFSGGETLSLPLNEYGHNKLCEIIYLCLGTENEIKDIRVLMGCKLTIEVYNNKIKSITR